jgi:signal transduction histidine kinase
MVVGIGPSCWMWPDPGMIACQRWTATVPAYPASIMKQRTAIRSRGLAWAALSLIDTPGSASELSDRFRADGATVQLERATELLEELVALGLVRLDVVGTAARYRRTPLGDQIAAGAITEGGELRPHLAELERLRSDLLTTVAHELRTPLTAIRTAVGLLLDPGTRAAPDQRQQLLQTLERNAEQLQRLADTTLEMARFRAGQTRLQLRRFDARELGDEVRSALTPLLDAKRQRLAMALGERPIWVFADHRRIERAVLNLVSNAHKFSAEGSEIRLGVRRIAEDVCWEVADDGDGIAEEDRPRLFERFFVSASDRTAGGIGLGLPIVLFTAQAHGGRVEVDSELGRGSVFRLIVPASGPLRDRE